MLAGDVVVAPQVGEKLFTGGVALLRLSSITAGEATRVREFAPNWCLEQLGVQSVALRLGPEMFWRSKDGRLQTRTAGVCILTARPRAWNLQF